MLNESPALDPIGEEWKSVGGNPSTLYWRHGKHKDHDQNPIIALDATAVSDDEEAMSKRNRIHSYPRGRKIETRLTKTTVSNTATSQKTTNGTRPDSTSMDQQKEKTSVRRLT
jgi:hypothetical protein